MFRSVRADQCVRPYAIIPIMTKPDIISRELRKYATKEKAAILQKFFKTGPGEYGEGDIFIGVKVPEIRKVAKEYKNISLKETVSILRSEIHEERLLAIVILTTKFADSEEKDRAKIYQTYLDNTKCINNWDLVDLSAGQIVGGYLTGKDTSPLYKLALSGSIWERRIAIIATFRFIKDNSFKDAIKIAEILLQDAEDLIHKAVGWMLREVGKRDMLTLETFLNKNYKKMPRTTLRYAIERFPETKRKSYLHLQ